MELIVDLHIHSHYSRATSPEMNISALYRWGKIKGINVIGTGDFTHPAWFAELQEKLEPAEAGLFKLKDEYAQEEDKRIPESCTPNLIRFILTVEVSTIYAKKGKVRKIHSVVVMPDFSSAAKLNEQLAKVGNLHADGRPILGMDCQELLQITLETAPTALFIPAHIWTPWFGVFGSKSGFDSLKEAFGKYSSEITAVETGLSSDPAMNWRIAELDQCAIISNSDAHSPQKLGREATIVNCELSYPAIISAIKNHDEHLIGTIEFFPQEGKYHYDGHRNCQVSFSPAETKKLQGICPVCGRPLTVGVEYRVEELATRPEGYMSAQAKKIEYIIPLTELIAQVKAVKSTQGKAVMAEYEQLYTTFGNEFSILRTVDPTKLSRAGFSEVAFAIEKMRAGKVHITPGYDGVYGEVRVFDSVAERHTAVGQLGLGI